MIALVLSWGACPDRVDAAQDIPPPKPGEDPFARFRKLDPFPAPLLPAERAWQVSVPIPSAGGALDQGRVYVPVRDGWLMALDRETGVSAWTRQIDTSSPPVVGNDAVYVVTTSMIHALDPATGEDRAAWAQTEPLAVPMTWHDGWLVTAQESGSISARQERAGQLVGWSRDLGSKARHPAVAGDSAWFVSLEDGRVVALARADGATLWEVKLPGLLSEPAIAPDRVLIGSTDNFFYTLDADTGELKWKWRGGGDVIGAAFDDDRLFFTSLDNIIRSVNAGNGNQRWKKETGTRPVFPPRAFSGVVVVPGLKPALAVFAGRTGASIGIYETLEPLMGKPLIDQALPPFRVALVTITRAGIVEGLRPTGLLFREPVPTLLTPLPGRPLTREPVP